MSDLYLQNKPLQNKLLQHKPLENESRKSKLRQVFASKAMTQKTSLLFISLVIILAISVLAAGCGLTSTQKKGVYSFGDAAVALGKAVSEELPAMRSNVIEMKKLTYAIENRVMKNRPTRESYERKMNIDSGLDPENIAKQLEAINLLVKYGTFLSSFTQDAADAELKKNAESLNEIKGLGKLAHAGGKIFIEWKKKKAIKKVISTLSPLIQKLCVELEKNFNVKGRGAALNVAIVQERLYAESIDGLKQKSGSVSDRMIQVEGFILAQDSRIRLRQVSQKIIVSVRALKKADDELLKLVTDNRVSIEKIKLFGEDTKDLISALKSLGR